MKSNSASPVLLHDAYAKQLRTHAVTLICMGHQRLDRRSLATADEDEITGELVKAMKTVTQDSTSPDWVDRYEVHEQVRQNVQNKLGKSRPMMDIEVECHRRGPRPRIGFEAKRLGRGSGVSDYLGDEGLSAFLTGYYPTTHGEGGMLGYVQDLAPGDWCSRLSTDLQKNSQKHRVEPNGHWQVAGNSPDWCSSRHLDTAGRPMFVLHVLLDCH
jgi:hypothetical protein